jgi:beta-mannosidase
MNGTLEDAHVQIEVRMYDIESGVLREKKILGNQILSPNRATELLEDLSVDEKTSVQAIMRDTQDGRVIARASEWPQPLKYVTLSGCPDVSVSVLDGKLEIQSRVPVKGIVVSVPDDRDVGFEDNGIDVFPDDVYTIYASGLVKGEKIAVRYYGSDFST